MGISGLEEHVGEYSFLVCMWIRVSKKNGGVQEIY